MGKKTLGCLYANVVSFLFYLKENHLNLQGRDIDEQNPRN